MYPPVLDHQDAICFLSETIVVCDHDEGDSIFAVHLSHDIEDLITGPAIEVACWFISENNLRLIGKRPDNGAALILAAAHRIRTLVKLFAQTDPLE